MLCCVGGARCAMLLDEKLKFKFENQKESCRVLFEFQCFELPPIVYCFFILFISFFIVLKYFSCLLRLLFFLLF